MKGTYEWKSVFAQVLKDYISLKRQSGFKFECQERHLRHFDTFYHNNGYGGDHLTKEAVDDFIYDPCERPVSHHNKEVIMHDFATYLFDRGYCAHIPEVKTALIRCKFIPRILTDDEVRRFLAATDSYPSTKMSYRNTVDPVLFRFLYSTGARISEALNLALDDVDIKAGVVRIRAGKNAKDRLIPMAESLAERILVFVDSFHRYSESKMWLFPGCHNGKMGQMDKSTAYNHFRDYLLMADIPHTSQGPRIHSFRHGLAVKCLKNWVLAGEELSVMLPYLSAYMGHSDFRATQYYLRLTSDLYPEIVRRHEAEFGYVIPEGGYIYDES
jgi:integrase